MMHMAADPQLLDDAVLAIQEAANKINSATSHFDGIEDKQDQLLSSFKTLAERVANLEQAATSNGKKKKEAHSVPLYERVSWYLWYNVATPISPIYLFTELGQSCVR